MIAYHPTRPDSIIIDEKVYAGSASGISKIAIGKAVRIAEAAIRLPYK